MTKEERAALEIEWAEINEKLKGEFVNPKDMRRKDEITSLLMTDGENANIKFNFLKGRGGNKGMNVTKPYNRKGNVG
jgi:hypothetical protein